LSQDEKIISPDDTTRIVEQDPSSDSHSSESAPEPSPPAVYPTDRSRKSSRADCGKLHRTRHGILSREALGALIKMGEDRKTLRRLERHFRAELRPAGPLGSLFFDRFWSSYLRLILIGLLETRLIGDQSLGRRSGTLSLALVPGSQPILVSQDSNGPTSETASFGEQLPPDLLRELVLVQRYDRHHSREMFRALAVLLLLRRGGEAALESWASEMLGASPPRRGD
jgi:hypothetical protein